MINSAKVRPVINKFLSQEEIELKDNEKIINYLSRNKKNSSSELKFANELLTRFSNEDLALALIENFKGKLPPIEEVESLGDDQIVQMKSDRKKKKRGRQNSRRNSRKR